MWSGCRSLGVGLVAVGGLAVRLWRSVVQDLGRKEKIEVLRSDACEEHRVQVSVLQLMHLMEESQQGQGQVWGQEWWQRG